MYYNEPTVYIAKKDLIHEAYYTGTCRNANVARWNGFNNKFYHHRTKFGHTYVETIKHPDDDDKYDVFFPFALANEHDEINFADDIRNQ